MNQHEPEAAWDFASSEWVALLYAAVACSSLAYFTMTWANQWLDATLVNLYSVLQPIVTGVLAYLFLDEALYWQACMLCPYPTGAQTSNLAWMAGRARRGASNCRLDSHQPCQPDGQHANRRAPARECHGATRCPTARPTAHQRRARHAGGASPGPWAAPLMRAARCYLKWCGACFFHYAAPFEFRHSHTRTISITHTF